MKCLNCDKEFEPKRPTAKFCSDNCRVKHHRKVGKKDEVKPYQIQALINQFKDLMMQNVGFTKEREGVPTPPLNNAENSYEAFYAMIAGARVYADLSKIVAKIERSDLLWKQKQALKELATQKSQNMYTD